MDTGFLRPSLTTLITRIQADINTRIAGADALLRRSVLNVLGRILAGISHGMYGYLDWTAKQVFPDTAEAENMERWAAIWGLSRTAAEKATGTVTLTGVNGSIGNINTRLLAGNGVEYVTTAAFTISGGTAVVPIEAVNAGDSGNADSGTVLTFISPIAGVTATGTTSTLTGGVDSESDGSLLVRLLDRLRQPPHGGADFDYKAWARLYAGVTDVWVYPLELGAGTVTVRFMMYDTYANGIPLTADVNEVQSLIDDERPVTANVTVVAPVAVPLNFTIDLKKADNTDENSVTVRNAVEAEIKDLLRRDAAPGGTIYLSRIREAISIAAGEHHHILSSPSADVTHTTGQIATMGTITWT
jgi:uncharacterized phage protein gp47/JayE